MSSTTTPKGDGSGGGSDEKFGVKNESSSAGASVKSDVNLRELKKDVFEKYEELAVIGRGSMGAISKVRIRPDKVGGSAFQPKKRGGFFGRLPFVKPKKTGGLEAPPSQDYVYAIKTIQLDRVSEMFVEELKNEIDILKSMDHPNIVKAHEVYSYKKEMYLVLELCSGGDLYTHFPYTEREAARISAQIVSAIRYMHDNGIVHRDLKFENIMFSGNSRDSIVKIIDFGLSKKFMGQPGYMTDRVGTIYTMAPQVLQGIYSSKADMWSMGVIAYMLLSSSKPFYHKRRNRMIDKIMRGDYDFQGKVWDNISEDAKDFVSNLLQVDPRDRFDAEKAANHPFIVKRELLPDELPSPEILESIEDSLMHYRQTSQLKKLGLMVIAHRSNQNDIMDLRKIFESFDTERNGTLSLSEFREAMRKGNYSDETINEMFESIDVHQNGKILYTEFLAATLEAHGQIAEDRIAEAFDRLDSDDTGYISRENLRDLLGDDVTPEIIDSILEAADVDKDGKISYEEFKSAFRKETEGIKAKVGADLHGSITSSIEDSHELLGLDAKIPGGKHDTA